MAEKSFKVPSLALVGSDYTITANSAAGAPDMLWWGNYQLASQSWVNNAIAGASVNVNALAGDGLIVSNNALAVSVGSGLYINADAIAVNTTTLAENGLTASSSGLQANIGNGLYFVGDGSFAVNTNAIATVAYVDAVVEGLHIHASVLYATTAGQITDPDSVTSSSAIDNTTLGALSNGARVLIKNATDSAKNGIYTWNDSLSLLTRATDYNTAAEIDAGDFFFVSEGTTNGDTGWVQTATVTTLGTDPIVFQQFSGAGTYVAGDGLSLDGNTFNVNTGSGLYINADAIAVNVDTLAGYGLTASGTALEVSVGSGLYVNTNTDTVEVNVTTLAGYGLTASGTALEVNPGSGLYVNTNTDTVDVNVTTLAGNGLTASGTALTLNLASSLYLSAPSNALDVNVDVVADSLQYKNYGATSFFIANDSATAKTVVGSEQATFTSSDTWVTVATLDYGSTGQPQGFEVLIVMSTGTQGSDPDKVRSSKLSGIYLGTSTTPEYTEYAIVESGGSITGADVQVTSLGEIQVKSTIGSGTYLRAAAEAKTIAR